MTNPFPPGTKLPNHLAIIPDGNRRWAKLHHLPSITGHQKGLRVLLQMAKQARKWGIHTVTLWGFSTENWQRDEKEVQYLMKIEEAMVKKYLPEFQKDKVRIIHLGRKDRIPQSFQKTLERFEKETALNHKHVLNLAVDYGGRDEIIRAVKRVLSSKYQVSSISEEDFAKFLDTHDQPYPYPDLLIRTSGEMRTSGLLPWQMAYAEFVFIKKHLPDCLIEDLRQAILEYSRRERRLGGN